MRPRRGFSCAARSTGPLVVWLVAAGAGLLWQVRCRDGGAAAVSKLAAAPLDIDAAHAVWRTAKDEETLHVFHTICAGGVHPSDATWHGLTVVKSILLAREAGPSKHRRYHFHIAVDRPMRNMLAAPAGEMRPDFVDVLAYIANRTQGRVTMSYYDVDTVLGATAASVSVAASAAVDNGLFKECSTIRLRLPFIGGALAAAPGVLYIDFDAIVTCDIESLWEEELRGTLGRAPYAFLAVSEEAPHRGYPTAYRPNPPHGPRHPSAFESGLNAGVAAVRLDRWRAVAAEYWGAVASIVKGGGYDAFNLTVHGKRGLTYGDQDILNILSAQRPEWFATLPLRYNWRFESVEASQGHLLRRLPPGATYEPQAPCIQHFTGHSAFSCVVPPLPACGASGIGAPSR